MANNWNTDNDQRYINIRLMADAKFFPEKGDKGAVTFLTVVHGTKGGEDIWVDIHVRRGAELAANYKKGDIVSIIRGPLHFAFDKKGVLRGKLFAEEVESQVNLKERAAANEAPADLGSRSSSGAAPDSRWPALPDIPTDLGGAAADDEDSEGIGSAFD